MVVGGMDMGMGVMDMEAMGVEAMDMEAMDMEGMVGMKKAMRKNLGL